MKVFNFSTNYRRATGNTLIMLLVLTLCLLAGVGFFTLQFAKLVGTKHENLNATEAAALAGAQALSKIVVEDRNVGFISASDYPPSGTATIADDNYALPVTGINTLAATVRLDMIIADLLDDTVLRRLARDDYNDYSYALQLLRAELIRCTQPGQTGKDIDGNTISILEEAQKAYLKNSAKMAGKAPTTDGFKLQLGFIPNLRTNMPIPSPTKFAFIEQDQQENGFYKSCVNVPYNNLNFSFAPAAEELTLADPQLFKEKLSGYVGLGIPTVVKVTAQQDYESTNFNGIKQSDSLTSEACAYGGIMHETRFRAGSLCLIFDGGNSLGIQSLKEVLTDSHFCLVPTDSTEIALKGDSPPEPLTSDTLKPFKDEHPPFGQVMRVALYDWIRRNRARINVQSLFDEIEAPNPINLKTEGTFYYMKKDGSIGRQTFFEAGVNKVGLMPVAHRQFRCVSGIARSLDDSDFDLIVKDFVHKRGRIEGGKHAGEVYPWNGGTIQQLAPHRQIDDETTQVYTYPTSNGSIKRPAWVNGWGVCSEIRIRKRS